MLSMRSRFPVILVLASLLVFTGCQGLTGDSPATDPSQPGNGGGSLNRSINHIVIMYQENRSFDQYFGKLGEYRSRNNIPGTIDGLPANASNPGYDQANDAPDPANPVSAFKLTTVCHENVSPAWNESHRQANVWDPNSKTANMDGFVVTAGSFAVSSNKGGADPQYLDTAGRRAMGYYDESHLPYYYYLASTFATSDRWFSPLMSRSAPNRIYGFAATSAGHVYGPKAPLNVKTIFDLLEAKGVSWKIYYTDKDPADNTPVTFGKYFEGFLTKYGSKVVPVSQYFDDLKNNTLPSVAWIESGYISGKDEHPNNNIQTGAKYVKTIIDALMASTAWKNSVFILTFDEAGGVYDHVPPAPAVSPDGIAPVDLQPGDYVDDFTRTGFRIPLLVVSPYARRSYVSHTNMDFTATLKLIQTRFGLSSLTKRDEAQPDMTEFFDFDNPPFLVPPAGIPDQPETAPCYFDRLP